MALFLSDGFRSEGIDTLMKPEHVKIEEGETLLIYSGSLFQYAVKERDEGRRVDKNVVSGVWAEVLIDEQDECERYVTDVRDAPFAFVLTDYFKTIPDRDDFDERYVRDKRTLQWRTCTPGSMRRKLCMEMKSDSIPP